MTSQSLLGGFWERQVEKTLVFQVSLASVSNAVESHLIPWNWDKQSERRLKIHQWDILKFCLCLSSVLRLKIQHSDKTSPAGEEITGTQIEKRERRLGWGGWGFEMSIWQCEGFCLADPVQGRLQARQPWLCQWCISRSHALTLWLSAKTGRGGRLGAL